MEAVMEAMMRNRISLVCLMASAMAALAPAAGGQDPCPRVERQPATLALIELLGADADLEASLAASIALGQIVNSDPGTNPVTDLEGYYDLIDALVTYNPQNIDTGVFNGKIRVGMDGANYCNWNILDLLSYSYFLVDRQVTTDPRGQVQFLDADFGAWMRDVAEAWGKYLETPPSAIHVPDFLSDPNFGDWYCPPEGGYTTFQDFFVRELCEKKFPHLSRPVEGYGDPATVVSIGDSNAAGWWSISDDGKLVTTYDGVAQSGRVIKGKLYSDVHEFIAGGPEEKVLAEFGSLNPAIFNGGTWTHQFLNVNNYHRLHTPVAGRLIYMKHLQAGVRLKSGWAAELPGQTAHYDPRDTADWQFGQTRMVIGIQTDHHGVVVISPMGMAQVSGIEARDWVVEGARADKGWEFANFKFGGSDFVVIFEERADFVLTVPHEPEVAPGAGVNYQPSLQGQKYGCFGGVTNCSDVPADPPPWPADE